MMQSHEGRKSSNYFQSKNTLAGDYFCTFGKKTALMSIQKVFSENLKFRSKASSLWRNFIQIAASMSISWKVLI